MPHAELETRVGYSKFGPRRGNSSGRGSRSLRQIDAIFFAPLHPCLRTERWTRADFERNFRVVKIAGYVWMLSFVRLHVNVWGYNAVSVGEGVANVIGI